LQKIGWGHLENCIKIHWTQKLRFPWKLTDKHVVQIHVCLNHPPRESGWNTIGFFPPHQTNQFH
jgi:hypothetical protein